jgi:DNA-binding NarL/FixJ family response regulator
LRIVIVEDEALIRLELEDIVRAAGHDVVGGAATGPDAIRLAEERRPDVILMDIALVGDMNGIDAAKTIHGRCAIRSLFVPAISAHLRDSADGARPFGFLLKPIAAERLVDALKEIARQLGKSG